VFVDQLKVSSLVRRQIQDELLLFFTGITRSANTILGEQTANIADRLPQLAQLRDLAGEAASGLRDGDVNALGTALNKSWQAKRVLASGVSNPQIDQMIEAALAAGATGAKVTGAGGGGFLLVVCPLERQRAAREQLAAMKELPINIEPFGSRVVLNVHRDIWG
jgi:D-glycero-alpha-D-manno-heptose-7-phosphate kinase